jgi:hypothetical protein
MACSEDELFGRVRGVGPDGEETDEPFVFTAETEHTIRSMGPHPEEIFSAKSDVLGCYYPMQSPGRIALDSTVIGSLFWHTALDMQQQGLHIERRDMPLMAAVTVQKTSLHETFHHFADVARHLFGGSFDHEAEEALAVACSYRDLVEMRGDWRSKPARLHGLLFRELVTRLYRYTAPGYRDWVRYQTPLTFEQGLIDYLGPASTPFLQGSGVDVASILGAVRKAMGTQGAVEWLTP